MRHFWTSFNCRLCWRITLVIFGLILAIESIILVPSAINFKQREYQQLAQKSQTLIEPALAQSQSAGTSLQDRLSAIIGHYGLHGVAVYSDSGEIIAKSGMTPPPATDTVIDNPMAMPLTLADDGSIMAAGWRSEQASRPIVTAWIDASHVSEALYAYMMRVAGLVGIIVLVVTFGSMLVLDLSVLRPLLSLRSSAMKAGRSTESASSYVLHTDRKDEIGELITAFNSMLIEVSESHRRNQEMAKERERFLTRHNPVTGLPNRTALEEFLGKQIRLGDQLLLLHINIPDYLTIDATYGEGTGEHITGIVAQTLRQKAEAGDFIAHTETDRFAFARIGDTNPLDAEILTEEILSIANQPIYSTRGERISFQLRAGLAISGNDAVTGKELISHADMALQRTYDDPGSKYDFYSSHLAERARQRQILLQDLKQGLDRNELFIVLQPKVKLQPQCRTELSGAEALIRWQHPRHGLVNPGIFIPLAESCGLIREINDFVMHSVCKRIRGWLDRYNSSPRIAINISGQEFSEPDFVSRINQTLAEHEIPPEFIELEITETTTMDDVDHTVQVLLDLRQLGVHISIDDFGTGYSSLSYLKRFSVDAIKIDKSFVEEIGRDRDSESICGAILRLGQTLGMRVIAEGVETEQQATFLCRRKCDEAQGYLFGKPSAIEEFEGTWLFQIHERNLELNISS